MEAPVVMTEAMLDAGIDALDDIIGPTSLRIQAETAFLAMMKVGLSQGIYMCAERSSDSSSPPGTALRHS